MEKELKEKLYRFCEELNGKTLAEVLEKRRMDTITRSWSKRDNGGGFREEPK